MFSSWRHHLGVPTLTCVAARPPLNVGNPQEAIQIFEEMHEVGVSPGLMTYNTLIAGCVRAEHPTEALSVFKLMKERNIKRDQASSGLF